MNESATRPSHSVFHWLAAYAGFPAQRLPARAETLLLFAEAAAQNNAVLSAGKRRRFPVPGQAAGEVAAAKAMAQRRKRAHFKCDNSNKV